MTGRAAMIDPRSLRDVLARFATGITVVTACGPDGQPFGLTVNSFAALSLDPPMVLWSLKRASPSLAAFTEARHWAVNILADDQADLSRRFATPGIDKFSGVACRPGEAGTPIIEGCLAWLQCRHAAHHAGGDHMILVGEVIDLAYRDKRPLVFFGGRYMAAAGLEDGRPSAN